MERVAAWLESPAPDVGDGCALGEGEGAGVGAAVVGAAVAVGKAAAVVGAAVVGAAVVGAAVVAAAVVEFAVTEATATWVGVGVDVLLLFRTRNSKTTTIMNRTTIPATASHIPVFFSGGGVGVGCW